MRIAALYDIHGNLPALRAVLAEVDSLGADLLLVGGDIVPGPMPAECLELIDGHALPKRWIRGNGDVDTVAAGRGAMPSRVPPPFHETMRWVAARLDATLLERMADWPMTETVEVEGVGEVLFCHATPRDENEIFTERTDAERLEPVMAAPGAELVICGHTHMPFDRTVGAVRVVNAGSVGMPFGDTRAQWVLVDGPRIDARRTEYDLASASDQIAATGYPVPMDLANPPSASAMGASLEAVALSQFKGE